MRYILILLGTVLLFFLYNKENFSDFPQRSILASTYWIRDPKKQFSLQELSLQNPNHLDYFENACKEDVPNNAEVCIHDRYRFDPRNY